jgi:hypothetical protein
MKEYIKKQIQINMEKLPLFEDFIPVGFGTDSMSTYSLGAYPAINTGYNMGAIVGPVMEAASCVAKEAHSYEMNDNPKHKAKDYIKEAKKHLNDKIDEAYENYNPTNEAMVQIAGNKKPSGAQVLAMVIIDNLESSKMLKPGVNTDTLKLAVQKMIMDNTF